MGRVVAIAGGDLLSTRKLNVHAITLSNKTTPNVLFTGTAVTMQRDILMQSPKNITNLIVK